MFPHINYEVGGVKEHLLMKNKIVNNGMWEVFLKAMEEEIKRLPD